MFPGAEAVALRRDLDAISMFYEERSANHCRKQFKVVDYPRPGQCFVFHGMILLACEHFVINFLSKQPGEVCDVLLQVGSRIPQNYITRNSRIMGLWGPEENSSNLSFQLTRGKSFWMQILLTEECFFISVNGYHFATYNHRVPYRWLETVAVLGDVADIVIDTYFVSEYPIRLSHSLPQVIQIRYDTATSRFLRDGDTRENDFIVLSTLAKNSAKQYMYRKGISLPFYGTLAEDITLVEGRALRIEGRVRLMPQSFSVALQIGQEIWPQPTVSFYFSPSFLRSRHDKIGKAMIKRGAYLNGEWQNLQETRLNTNLRPGGAFVIVIACRKGYYELFVNTKLMLQFKYQMSPERVDMVNIRGDIVLWEVGIEGSKVTPKGKGNYI